MSLAQRVEDERRARLAAEQMLELKHAELMTLKARWSAKSQKLASEIHQVRNDYKTAVRTARHLKTQIESAGHRAEQAEQRLWSTIGAVRDGFAFYDAKGEMLGANPAYLACFANAEVIKPGVHLNDVIDHAFQTGLIDCEDEDPVAVRADLIETLRDENATPYLVKLWNERFVQLSMTTGENGDRISLIMDVTDAITQEAALRAAMEAAEAAQQTKSAFLANMSHEIRTPMNGLVGMADLLMDTELNEEQHLFASTIKNSGEALMSVINDVLDYSNIGAGQLALRQDPFDLERCIHEVIAMLQIPARERNLELSVDYDLFLPTEFVGDPARVR